MSNIHKLVLRNIFGHEPVVQGDVVKGHDGVEFTLTGFVWNHRFASTGRVYVIPISNPDAFASSFFPSVFLLEMVAVDKETGETKELWQL